VPDVALVAEPGAPVATIERTDDDYFVRSALVQVNDKPTTSKLLMTGDRIALSPRLPHDVHAAESGQHHRRARPDRRPLPARRRPPRDPARPRHHHRPGQRHAHSL
jgi:hypothetical protein